ncbi:EAL and HDOD domain-containing protein [Acidithiobacillus sp. IBUN Pt1247-S3]|uniref:EAL and HDOD domain-containing protein n=1 Tax=Acidithiobacillus sp. IBUN Pt1247-S3 TaxID=3166642 RepID=UPI0034E3F351
MNDTTDKIAASLDLVARQAILDGKGNVQAYELLAREEYSPTEDPFLASAQVLVKVFSIYQLEQLLDGKKAFINFTNSLFDEKTLELFPCERVVPEFTITENPDRDFLGKVQYLKQSGFRIALDRFSGQVWEVALLRWVNYVKIDVNSLDVSEIQKLLKLVRAQKYATRMPLLIATRVETREQADFCFANGFDWSQGYFFMRPQIVSSRHVGNDQRNLFQLLNLLSGDGPIDEIEEGFRHDPTLSFQLLRYLNSAGMRRGREIDSIRQALLVLGRVPLQRWLTLLMFTSQGPRKHSLLAMASSRARLAELLRMESAHLEQAPEALHRSFLVGMLSLIDALFDQPLAELLGELKLHPSVTAALLEREGEDGVLLQLLESIEQGDYQAVQQWAKHAGVPIASVNRLALEAMAWTAALPR